MVYFYRCFALVLYIFKLTFIQKTLPAVTVVFVLAFQADQLDFFC